MLGGLSSLALEVKYLDRARAFYVDRLGAEPVAETDDELRFRIGETTLVLRRPRTVPRGGLHVHYAFTTPREELDAWRDRLDGLDVEERSFGSYRSLYVDDPDDHCVEIGGMEREIDSSEASGGSSTEPERSSDASNRSSDVPELTGIFEVVFEVEDLERAESLYTTLGFEVVDRGDQRRRVRLRGPFDLELWEPQLGIADARGGVHVDLGLTADEPESVIERVADDVVRMDGHVDGEVGGRVDDEVDDQIDDEVDDQIDDATEGNDGSNGVRFRDPDGHYVTIRQS